MTRGKVSVSPFSVIICFFLAFLFTGSISHTHDRNFVLLSVDGEGAMVLKMAVNGRLWVETSVGIDQSNHSLAFVRLTDGTQLAEMITRHDKMVDCRVTSSPRVVLEFSQEFSHNLPQKETCPIETLSDYYSRFRKHSSLKPQQVKDLSSSVVNQLSNTTIHDTFYFNQHRAKSRNHHKLVRNSSVFLFSILESEEQLSGTLNLKAKYLNRIFRNHNLCETHRHSSDVKWNTFSQFDIPTLLYRQNYHNGRHSARHLRHWKKTNRRRRFHHQRKTKPSEGMSSSTSSSSRRSSSSSSSSLQTSLSSRLSKSVVVPPTRIPGVTRDDGNGRPTHFTHNLTTSQASSSSASRSLPSTSLQLVQNVDEILRGNDMETVRGMSEIIGRGNGLYSKVDIRDGRRPTVGGDSKDGVIKMDGGNGSVPLIQDNGSDSPIQERSETPHFSQSRRSSRHKRDLLTGWMIFPGTKWCGDGDIADHENDLGYHSQLDSCCRRHDLCQAIIPRLTHKYGMFNYRPHTISHCRCDRKFRKCLQATATPISTLIGRIYFNVIGPQCFKFRQERTCVKRVWWGACQKHGNRKVAYLKRQRRYRKYPRHNRKLRRRHKDKSYLITNEL